VSQTFDWSAFEQNLFDMLLAGVGRTASLHPDEPFYALALHHVYRERDGRLLLPLLALALESGSPPRAGDGFSGSRLSPWDFSHPEVGLSEEEEWRAFELALTAEATRSNVAHWDAVESRYFQVLVDVARRLRDAAPDRLTVTADFVAFVHDLDLAHGVELARRTIPEERFTELFATELALAAEKAALAERPAAEQARVLVSRFGCYEGITSKMAQRGLLALGEAAIEALVEALPGTHGWTAAKVLGQIGALDPAAVAALREGAAQSLWHAMALGMLGDHDWLVEQQPVTAVRGLCAPLKAITEGRPRPLDYGPLEGYLKRAPRARPLAEAELEPGSSYVTIRSGDVAEACRGMASDEPVVRWHAASVARARELGDAAGALLVPALAERLSDAHPIVRRLALLSLGSWKEAAEPYHAAMAALSDDPDETVRGLVDHALRR